MAEQEAPSGPTEGAQHAESGREEPCGAASPSTALLLAPEAPAAGCEERECRICYNLFDAERHAPKLLECLHTFCLHCLRQLQLRAARGWATGGGAGAASIRCPLCSHRTALPGGSAHSLPANTKCLQATLLPWHGWAPGPAHQRPLPEHDGQGADGAGAGGSEGSSLGSPQAGSDLCCASWRKVLGCLCVVLAVLLLAAAWLRWVPLPIFLAVAVGLFFCSTLPFLVFYFRFASGQRTIFLRRRATSSG
ncbi:RING finger protein 228-like [Tiliqua scincoides]|uniref:RING finger protein 228-like n=1 Tax=Tiliqua scincoides TaxID=71010 RepID=UPI0034634EB1